MAPTPRNAVAVDRQPVLKLTFEKGPISGQTAEFNPGSRIRIGRVIRGNTLSVKDAGISSKHLLIQVDSGGEGGWTITDLGSSNGTILNTVQLEPSVPAILSDGDIIKIGEQTSMKVKFELHTAGNEVNSRNLRRSTRRNRVDLDVDEEKTEQLAQVEEEENKLEDSNDSGPIMVERGPRTRSSRKEEKVGLGLGVVKGRRTRKDTKTKNMLTEVKENVELNLDHEECGKGTFGREEEAAFAFASSSAGVKDGIEDAVVDLEKMTLWEWLDFLDVFLPQQIIHQTEEIISDMRQKAERLHEFRSQQRGMGRPKGDVAWDQL